MKVAVSATGCDLTASVDRRFGRCPWFLFVDGASLDFEAVENKNADEASGAGTACAQLVLEHDAEAVISGQVGPNAFEVLKQGGVKILIASEGTSVRDALTQYQNGKLRQMEMKVF
jgi:predicted Fe-Mo cluster-binding NifX family protein